MRGHNQQQTTEHKLLKKTGHEDMRFTKTLSKLEYKRCVAFQHCELEALQYYGSPTDHRKKVQ